MNKEMRIATSQGDVVIDIFDSEIHTLDFSKHCDSCWFCKEREWGFGRYE